MSVLRFANQEALRFAVTSSLVAEEILGAAAKTWRGPDGRICIASEKAFHPEAMKRLAAAGVERLPSMTSSPSARSVRCWAEIVDVVRTGTPPEPGVVVLFRLAAGASLVDLAGELLRLGCDRLEWRATEGGGFLLRAAAPPFYSVLRALDAGATIRAYVPTPPGQDRVWTEIGGEHPLARFLRPEDGHVLLVAADGFETVPDAAFEDIYTLVDLRVPGRDAEAGRVAHAPVEPPRLSVTLRLSRAATGGAPSLWVVRDDAVVKIEQLLAALPEDVARGLLFAACLEEGATIIVLRLRPGTRAEIGITGETYRPHPSIANLFLPGDATLEPPLRRDHVQALLAPDPDAVVWLRPRGSGFRVESTADAAFRPLTEWVDYIIDTNAPALVPWVASTTFDFDAFLGVDLVAPTSHDAPAPETPAPRRKPKREAARADPRRDLDPAPAQPARAPLDAGPLEPMRIDRNAVAEELSVVEREYLALDVPVDDPARGALWTRMAPLNLQLGRGHDAAMAWVRVVWEGGDAALPTWLAAERSTGRVMTMPALLALDAPSRDDARLVAVVLQSMDESARSRAHDASLWLDRHDDLLDVRTAWLARVALSTLSGGDRLGLARARDRLLGRIHRGLSLERDVPSFLRRAGAGRDATQIELLSARLEGLVQAFDTTKRKRSATEADPRLTGAYVRFVVAYGLARIGRTERAGELRDAARESLPPDAIHDVLSRAYVARIAQALEGMVAETPLPPDVSAALAGLAKLERYKVDRVRQASKVLEPHERLDPIMAFQRGDADPRGPEFAELRGADLAATDRGLAAIMGQAERAPPEDRARLYDGVMDFFPALAHDRACGHLERILANVADISPLKRAQVLEEALMLAGHFGEEPLARRTFGLLEPLVAGIGPEGAVEIAPLASGMLRTLRRFGLRDEAYQLLAALEAAARGKATPHLVARLHIASALAFLGETERALPVYEEALNALAGDLPMPERLQIGRGLGRALGTAPFAFAIAGLDRIRARLDIVTDSFNTNTHVCLSIVDFIEALVLGYASEELAVDHAARRFLDEDEYLVRRRIHRDLSR